MANEEKSTQLGMPFGTANARLRKSVLFNLVVKHHENICYRCDKLIDNIDDFSLDHKKAWFKISTDLFWDVDNIAFAHIDCNIRARRIPEVQETKRCHMCKLFKSRDYFYNHDSACKPCSIARSDIRRRTRGERPAVPKFLRGSKYN